MKSVLALRRAFIVGSALLVIAPPVFSSPCAGLQTPEKVVVNLRLETPEVKEGDPVRGTVDVTLSGFASPQEILVTASVADDLGKSSITPSFSVMLMGRTNGVHKISLSGDLGCFADVEAPGSHAVRIFAVAGYKNASTQRSVMVVDDPAFTRRFRQPALDYRSKFVPEYPLNSPVRIHLANSILCRDGSEARAAEIVQNARIVGASSLPLKAINHKLEKASNEAGFSSTWTVVFPKPGAYRLEFELSAEGFKPLKGHLNILVREPGMAADLRIWMDSSKVSSGKTFTILASYETTELQSSKEAKFSENLTISGPENLKIEKVRAIPLSGPVEVEISYKVTLVKPGIYTWRMAVAADTQEPAIDRTGSLTVEPSGKGNAAAWTRGQATLKESSHPSLTGGSGSAQWIFRDPWGVEAVSVITWSSPPASLSDGDEFDVEITATPWKPRGAEMPKGVPEFNASFFLTACLPVEGPGKRCSVNTRSGPMTSRVRHRFSSRLAGGKPVTIMLAVNPAFKDITLAETWTYTLGASLPIGKSSLAEVGEAVVKQKVDPRGGNSPKLEGKDRDVAEKSAKNALPKLDVVIAGFRFGWKDGLPSIAELIYPDIAESLGLKVGDSIAELNGRRTSEMDPEEIVKILGKDGPRPLTIKIRRGDGILVTVGVGR